MDSVDQPNSICHIQSIHMYALQPSDPQKSPPFALLVGETVQHLGSSVGGLVCVTNYRLYIQNGENQYHIPLGVVEFVEIRELFYLQLFCKDARTYRCTFENNESALDWYDKVSKAVEPPQQIDQLFAFYHCIWAKEKGGEEAAIKIARQRSYTFGRDMFENEMIRMQFQGDSWRITKANENYKICPTYPPYLLVPSCIDDDMLESVAKFRSSRRIPVAVWRHMKNGAVIARCSQPEVGWFGWRSSSDEDLLKAISEACNFDRNLRANSNSDKDSVLSHSPGSLHSEESLQITGDVLQQEKKLLIMDARSYTTAVANRARGGGCEYIEYYPNCEIQFMNLANIHSIRKSFHALRQLCMTSADQPNWFSLLEGTRWLLNMSGLLKAAVTLANAVERDARPALVHCSDGWDRTPQIVALAELLLDPYYRTIDGFRVLIEREWLAFGHKFADRCGHSGGSEDLNERCPVFLQWLDCVHQLMSQFPVSFEFSPGYLIKLVQHTYSNLYGTFLCNTQKQRSKIVHGKTFSVWEFLNAGTFKNHLYASVQSNSSASRVLWPKTNVRDLRLWSEVYLDSVEVNFNPEEACPGPPSFNGHLNMSKTRSYGDLINADVCHSLYGRRNSDPSMNRELKLVPHEDSDTTVVVNGGSNMDSVSDFQPSDMEDNVECTQDCIYNSHSNPTANLTDDQIDGLGFDEDHLHLNGVAYTNGNSKNEVEEAQKPFLAENWSRINLGSTGNTEESQAEGIKAETVDDLLVNNNNSSFSRRNLVDTSDSNNSSDTRDVESVLCKAGEQVGKILDLERSVETSTETLVSDHHIPGSSPKEYNGFEKIRNPIDTIDAPDNCTVCGQTEKLFNGRDCRYLSNAPNHSSEWQGAYMHNHNRNHPNRLINCQLGEDGLVNVRSPIHERLDQITEEFKRRLELLERELHASRQILIKQACHRCLNGDSERPDDSCSTSNSTSSSRSSCRLIVTRHSESSDNPSSVVESVNSAGEDHASAGESLRSDKSWVNVEEGVVAECQGTLWVPDHAASNCTNCGIEFWLGRRRHHCRKCGRVFCADCSEHATPVPSEQLYNPVRVCSTCYCELKQDDQSTSTVELTDSLSSRCRRPSSGPQDCSRIHHPIAASSN
ncbi:myotubularin-related protein 4 isoform X2 [Euwallacea similis]